ncbi:hypothetical protein BD309DRAFT_863762 [Dichomitus squalens]|nr:hypothetical protein BD309DRAFT_863762 [Dichomitus squalens]
MSAIIWSWTSVQRIIREANNGLYSDSYNGHDSLAALKAAAYRQSWMVTVPLGVNIVIGDAIVWWRAAVIWQNRVVYWVGPILVTMTLALGIIGSVTASPATPDQIFFWWGTDGFTNAAVILSCVTNTTATILIACKAWMHRLSLKKYFHAKTRVLKALALLVESGTIYCALLILVLVSLMDPASLANTLEYHTVGYYFVYGALTPMVAIYPTIIIVLVAVNRSPLERGILVDYPRGLPLTTTSTSTVVFGRGTMLPSPLVVAEEAHVVLGRAISRSDIDDGETLKGRSFEFERGDNKPFPSADSVLDIHS